MKKFAILCAGVFALAIMVFSADSPVYAGGDCANCGGSPASKPSPPPSDNGGGDHGGCKGNCGGPGEKPSPPPTVDHKPPTVVVKVPSGGGDATKKRKCPSCESGWVLIIKSVPKTIDGCPSVCDIYRDGDGKKRWMCRAIKK